MKTKEKTDAVEALRKAVEKRYRHAMTTPAEFVRLSKEVQAITGMTVSRSTLMRIWGYVTATVHPSVSTLNTLSVYVGYKSFEQFCERGGDEVSRDILSPHLSVLEDLENRDHVTLRWQPGRECRLRYLGGGQFVVERSERSRLSAGDTFFCQLIVEGEPTYMYNLIHQNNPPRTYVCGLRGGVTFTVEKADAKQG